MDARETLRSGDVLGAMEQLKQEVRKAPRDPRLRTFLFQMFCITSEWDRALTQLTVASELDPLALPMAEAYRAAIRCEVMREGVFRAERSPTVLGDPGPYVPLLMEATKLLAAGKHDEAATLRDSAFDLAPETAGTVNDTAFAWIGDADPRLGPVMEIFVKGNYMWVPFTRIKSIKFDPPADLRDQVWMPAQFMWTNDGEAHGFVPTRYPGSTAASDPQLMTSRRTDWHDISPDWALPLGQRILVTDGEETALMDIRTLTIAPADAGAA